MSRMRKDRPGPNVQETVEALLGRKLPGSNATMQDILLSLNEAAAAVADAHAERDHWRAAYGTIQSEIKFLLATFMRKGCSPGQQKLFVSVKDIQDLQAGYDVFVGNPEPGIRIYELRRKADADHSTGGTLQ